MSSKMAKFNYYELLELGRNATAWDIEQAYARARQTFDSNSNAIYSLFSPTELQQIRQQLETAHQTLRNPRDREAYDAWLDQHETGEAVAASDPDVTPRPTPAEQPGSGGWPGETATAEQPDDGANERRMSDSLSTPPAEIEEFSGAVLRQLRVQRDLTIKDVAVMTNIGTRYLEDIEEENFSRLPVRAYLQGYLGLFARALGYQPERIVTDYLRRYEQKKGSDIPETGKKSWWRAGN